MRGCQGLFINWWDSRTNGFAWPTIDYNPLVLLPVPCHKGVLTPVAALCTTRLFVLTSTVGSIGFTLCPVVPAFRENSVGN